jgi:hypothetical protein
MTPAEFALWALVWGAGAVVFLRRPLVVVGLVAAGVAWTSVGPWAGWLTLAAVVTGVAVGRRSGRQGRGLLGRGPIVATAGLSAAVTVLAPGWWVLAGLAGLVGSWVWWVRSAGYRLVVHRPTRTAVTGRADRPGRAADGQAPPGRRLGVTTCPCGGLVVIDAHVTTDPAAAVARATCGACGTRYWGAVDPADPTGGAVWFDVPAGASPQTQRGDRS